MSQGAAKSGMGLGTKWKITVVAVITVGLAGAGLFEAMRAGLALAAVGLAWTALAVLGLAARAARAGEHGAVPPREPSASSHEGPRVRREPSTGEGATDRLTGLLTHRQFQERLSAEVDRAGRSGGELSLVMIDLDDFHLYNAQNGYAAGDGALERLAALLGECLREGDVAARYGGEELVVILPGTGEHHAAITAETIRVAVATEPFAHRERQPGGLVTVSIGVASFPRHAADGAELVAEADRALYLAKARGRDRVVVAPPPSQRSAVMESVADVEWSEPARPGGGVRRAAPTTHRAPGTLRGPGPLRPAAPAEEPSPASAGNEPPREEPPIASVALGDGSTTLVSAGEEPDGAEPSGAT